MHVYRDVYEAAGLELISCDFGGGVSADRILCFASLIYRSLHNIKGSDEDIEYSLFIWMHL